MDSMEWKQGDVYGKKAEGTAALVLREQEKEARSVPR